MSGIIDNHMANIPEAYRELSTAELESLSTEELEAIIDYSFDEVEMDLGVLFKIMDILRIRGVLPEVEVAAAWEEFQTYYSGREETFPLPPDWKP